MVCHFSRFRRRGACNDAGLPASYPLPRCPEHYGLAVRKLRGDRQAAAHGFDIARQVRNHKITSLFDFGNALLPDMQGFGDALLHELARAAGLLKG